jgi:VWFA-related protein
VYSRETVVDVTVTDAKGQPVRGLTRADFSLEEDSKAQSIRSFAETGKDGPAVVRTLPKLPPNIYTNLQPAPAAGAVNIILLDALNVNGMQQMYSRQEAEKYLKTMPPGTQVALLGLANGLRILQGFTSDPKVLIAAMNDPKNGLLAPSSVNSPYCISQDLKNRMTLEALREIAAFVAGTKGRKNLLWFTFGMKTAVFPPLNCLPDYAPDLHKTYEMLTASQVAVYSIDPRGPVLSPETAMDHLAMEAVAEATGGGAYYNTNDVTGAVAKAIESGANYYTLSYVPPGEKFDGKHHTIKVKVERPGVHLVYRDEYYAEDPAKIAHAAVPALATATPEPGSGKPQINTMVASMARFAPPATQLLFDVQVEPTVTAPNPFDPPVMGALDPKLKGKPLVRYDFLYMLPVEQITFADGPDGTHNGSVEFDIVAYDLLGKPVTSISQTMKLPLTSDEYQQFVKRPFQFLQQLDLPAGEMFLRVGVHDDGSEKVGTLDIPLTLGKKAAAPAVAAGAKDAR